MEKYSGRIMPIYTQIPRRNLLQSSRKKKLCVIHEVSTEHPLFIRKKHQQQHPKNDEKFINFSKHDNRHSLQDRGEYFGQGLGKRFFKDINHHRTQFTLLNQRHHLEEQNTDSSSQSQNEQKLPDTKSPQKDIISKHRRFPRQYNKPSPNNTISTDTTSWWPSTDNFRNTTQVLTITQNSQRQANSWHYSYKSTIFPSIATRCGSDGKHGITSIC